ncbi:hypothetical protein [Streptomyces sp. NPDC058695]|uniref:hypothetical protein n=1 Tax=Streptomyces sp. NPDC058695 TaxID=3346604 RepID=UPI0036518093
MEIIAVLDAEAFESRLGSTALGRKVPPGQWFRGNVDKLLNSEAGRPKFSSSQVP